MGKTTNKLLVLFSGLILIVVLGILSLPQPNYHPPAPTPAPGGIAEQSPSSQKIDTSASIRTDAIQQTNKSQDLTNAKNVKYVSPEANDPTFTTEDGVTYPLRSYKLLAANDPYASQWWTTSTGLPTAWSIGPGAYTPTVAIIDTGISLAHEEFTNRWAFNANEQGQTTQQNTSVLNCTARSLVLNKSCNLIDDNFDGIVDNETGATSSQNPSRLNCTDQSIPLNKSCNLIDDDNNGYTDDVTGWDFANFDASVQAGQTNPNGDGTTHATEVAGVLAANGNNAKGIAGVNWGAKILPLQALNDDSYGNTLSVARAVYYAASRNVDIINISLGSDAEDSYLRQAIQYALDKGVFVVAASGNEGMSSLSYPAQYPEVFAVGAQQPNGTPATFSNYGGSLDIVAPGENITTTTWTKTNASSYVSGIAGTSFSAPYVTGLLSLMRSQQPNATWGELSSALLATTSHPGLSNNNPWSAQLGSGYARADAAMQRAITQATPQMRYTLLTNTRTTPGTLASTRTYQCFEPTDYPSALFYRIANSTSTYYTIDTLDSIRAASAGYTVRNLGRQCVGLPGDNPAVNRLINSVREFDNGVGIGK